MLLYKNLKKILYNSKYRLNLNKNKIKKPFSLSFGVIICSEKILIILFSW